MANWLTRMFETKASAFGPMISQMLLGRPAWPNRNQELQAREGYQRNIIAYRSIRKVAESAASIPWLLYDGDKEVEEHPLLDLLQDPNPAQDGTSLFEAWYSFLQITGNNYMERVDGLGKEPIELYALRPDRTKVIPGPQGFPMGWEYMVNGNARRVDADFDKGIIPILQVKLFHPLDDWYGMSPLDAAAWSVDAHSGASAFNKALLENSAVPSGALKVLPDKEGKADLSDKASERLKQELESRFMGTRNAGRPMVLEGGLDWVAFSMKMKDMEFVEGKRDSAREIALAFGVPPMLLGIPGDNTYSNYQEANRAFWRETAIPLAKRGARAVTEWLCPAYQTGKKQRLKLVPDLDTIEALADERQAAWDRIEKSTSLTVNEKREAHGYDRRKEGDCIIVPAKATTLALLGKEPKDKSNRQQRDDKPSNEE